MTSACQFFGSFNRATFNDVECIFTSKKEETKTLHRVRRSLTFVCEPVLLALKLLKLSVVSQRIGKQMGVSHLSRISIE